MSASGPAESRPSDIGTAESRPIDIGTVDRPEPAFADDLPPGEEAADEKSRRRVPARRIALGVVLAVGLAGAVAFGRTGWQIYTQKDATLSAPAQIGGLTLDDSASGQETAEYLRTALAAEVELDKAVGAVYRDTAGKNVLFLGGTNLFWTPSDDLDTAFGLISDNEGAVTGLHDVDAGPLGGTMKCGNTKTEDGALTVCGWADHGSLAMAMFPDRTEPEAATLFREIRSTAQTR
ncbi:hypothetical protein Ade02nite_40780 [Paractinoplanes deccanensis]|uniref:Uncharacterized protein n=1 Tax=Paractinoplanes deccanensis TaxID=113561 RepID=A0ABQ3Y621_9ACTN|nr:hypothetical protein [Actinoplanes deccanensis]GID75437.1 hypothetical protein Ade02nite_40780 [Actinoplanes deccanensis]